VIAPLALGSSRAASQPASTGRLKVRAVCVLEEVSVCDRGRGLLVLFLGKLCDVLARL
jgi:hypothetical protein